MDELVRLQADRSIELIRAGVSHLNPKKKCEKEKINEQEIIF